MPRLEAVDPSTATGKPKEILDGIQDLHGFSWSPQISSYWQADPRISSHY